MTARTRFTVSGTAGSRDGKRFVVLDRDDHQDGRGIRRVSFHRTFAQAKAAAKRLNEETSR